MKNIYFVYFNAEVSVQNAEVLRYKNRCLRYNATIFQNNTKITAMIYALYANAFQLISLCMFKSGGTEKKKTDVVATHDTKNLSCDVASNYKM